MAQKPAGDRAAAQRRPRGTTAQGDWRDVAAALDTLGDTIARATAAAVENEEIRTRLRDLAEGLAALSLRVSASLGEIAGSGDAGSRPLARPYAPARPDQFRPQVLDAVSAANEKFRRAAEDWDNPTEQMAPVAAVAPVRAPIVAGAVAPVAFGVATAPTAAAFAAAPTIEMPPVSARSSVPAGAAGLSPDRLAAVKAASQRFASERREAEEVAAAVAPAPEPDAVPLQAQDGIESWLASAPSDEPEPLEPVIAVEPVATPAPKRRAPRKPKVPAVAPSGAEVSGEMPVDAPAEPAAADVPPAPPAPKTRSSRKVASAKAAE